jgi:AcrR family transcriptional regulator
MTDEMETPRPLRADAERNRRALLEAATVAFCEGGLEVGVGEIAQRAGVGRGTVFRHFPTKEHLIAAIVVERINEAIARGVALLDAPDPGDALFGFIEDTVGRQRADYALIQGLGDTWLANDGIRAAHAGLVRVLGQLLGRAQDTGQARPDIGALDVLIMVKGACEASRSFLHLDPEIGDRQLDLVRAAIGLGDAGRPLRGQPPSPEDLERAFPAGDDPSARASGRVAPGA